MMRVSIWQQFSSNHSASFTIVGQFGTEDKAIRAANELRQILSSIVSWHETHPEVWEMWDSGDTPPPTEPETQAAQQYKVDWGEHAIPWFYQVKVSQFKDFVFVDSDGQVDAGAAPFHEVVARLGGKVGVDGDILEQVERHELEFDLSANAPDDPTAEQILDEITSFFAPPKYDIWENPRTISIFAPWEFYGTRYRLPFASNLHIIPKDRRRGLDTATPNFVKALVPILKAETLDDRLISEFVERIRQLADPDFDIFIKPDQLKDNMNEVIRMTLLFSYYKAGGDIIRNGREIQLSNLGFSSAADGFPALIRYLADKGCTDIQYSFRESEEEDD